MSAEEMKTILDRIKDDALRASAIASQMKALQEREMPSEEEINKAARVYVELETKDLFTYSNQLTKKMSYDFKAGVQWCLDWMKKGEKKC